MLLKPRGLLDIAADEDRLSPGARVHHAHSLGPAQVRLPALKAGAAFLGHWPLREWPAGVSWRADHYECMAPAMFILRDALVHSSAGLIGLGGDLVAETLAHTDPERQNYARSGDFVTLRQGPVEKLAGTHISILAGGAGNYFHATVESTLRLAMVPAHLLAEAESLLLPAGATGQQEMLDCLDLPAHLRRREVGDDVALRVERLVFPWTIHGQSSYHPCASAYFDRISANVADSDACFPRRIYIDRRGSPLRPMRNEAELIACLVRFGFVPVDPGTLCVADQIRLFRQAEFVVAPHGAALTNLGFCRPGCRVLEVLMDAYANWCFRHLAALRGLRYDCVVGQAEYGWPEDWSSIHAMPWCVSAFHVEAAVLAALEGEDAVPS